MADGHLVLIAASGRSMYLLKKEFPDLTFIDLPGYNVSYSTRSNQLVKMIYSIPRILSGIIREHRQLKKIIDAYQIDLVLSDNRYGLWSKQIKSVFITHQLRIKCPPIVKFMEYPLFLITRFFITKYSQCWIPDSDTENNLSGDLSHSRHLPSNTRFIGHLSRFSQSETTEKKKFTYDLMVILSGPEPQRTIFEEIIIRQLSVSGLNAVIIRGITETENEYFLENHIKVFSHLSSNELKKYMDESELILCRSGYSGIMDLLSMNKPAILVPTPGQTEQEYLAAYLKQKNIFYSVPQKEFNLPVALKKNKSFERNVYFCNMYDINALIQSL